MGTTEFLRAQIDRSTQRLAQLKARELITEQRNEAKAREAARRADAHRKIELGGLVLASGCADLVAGELVGALLAYRAKVTEQSQRDHHKMQGELFLRKREAARGTARLH